MNKTIAVILLLLLSACDETPANPADFWIAQGKRQLAAGAWAPARASFEKAEKLHPGNAEAEYGIVLAEVRHFWGVLDLAAQLTGGDVLGAPGYQMAATRGSLDDWLRQVFIELDATMAGLTERTGRLRDNPAAAIRLEHFPFSIGDKVYLDFGGEWDRSDAILLDALFASASALVRTLNSQEFAVGVTPMYSDYVLLGESFAPNVISAVLARNLNREPAWLTLKEATENAPGGDEQWRAAGAYWLRAAEDFQLLAVSLAAERDNQEDDILRLEPDKKKDFLLQQPATDRKPARFLWDGATVSVKAAAERLAENLKEEGTPRMRLSEDLLVLGIVTLDALRQSMDIQEFTAEFGVELPELIGDFLRLPSSSGEGFANGILGVASDYVPSGLVELNVGGFYRHPANLRTVMPLWQVTANGVRDGFLFSYECPRFESSGQLKANGSLQVAIFDSGRNITPGAGNDTLPLFFRTYSAGPTDAEHIALTEDSEAEGWFDVTFVPTGTPVALWDDVLQLAGNPVTTTATFIDTLALPDATFELRWEDSVRKDKLPDAEDFLCDAATRDAPHFKDAIAADGIYGDLPYIPFGDPTFNGLLYLNPTPLTGLEPLEEWAPEAFGFTNAMQAAGSRTLNALLQAYGALLD